VCAMVDQSFTMEILLEMSRRDIQELCKANGIKANGKTEQMREQLVGCDPAGGAMDIDEQPAEQPVAEEVVPDEKPAIKKRGKKSNPVESAGTESVVAESPRAKRSRRNQINREVAEPVAVEKASLPRASRRGARKLDEVVIEEKATPAEETSEEIAIEEKASSRRSSRSVKPTDDEPMEEVAIEEKASSRRSSRSIKPADDEPMEEVEIEEKASSRRSSRSIKPTDDEPMEEVAIEEKASSRRSSRSIKPTDEKVAVEPAASSIEHVSQSPSRRNSISKGIRYDDIPVQSIANIAVSPFIFKETVTMEIDPAATAAAAQARDAVSRMEQLKKERAFKASSNKAINRVLKKGERQRAHDKLGSCAVQRKKVLASKPVKRTPVKDWDAIHARMFAKEKSVKQHLLQKKPTPIKPAQPDKLKVGHVYEKKVIRGGGKVEIVKCIRGGQPVKSMKGVATSAPSRGVQPCGVDKPKVNASGRYVGVVKPIEKIKPHLTPRNAKDLKKERPKFDLKASLARKPTWSMKIASSASKSKLGDSTNTTPMSQAMV